MNTSIGDRLRDLRALRDGMTQEQLAHRAGVSIETVRRIEQRDDIASTTVATIEKLATALDVSLAALMGQPTMTTALPDAGGIVALRNALQDTAMSMGELDLFGEPGQAPPTLADIRWAFDRAQAHYQAGAFGDLVAVLPALVRDVHAVLRDAEGGPDHDEAFSVCAAVHIIASDLATQLGQSDLAFQAVQRSLYAARRASDPLREALAVSTLSLVLLRQGRWREAQEIAARKAAEIEPRFSTRDTRQIAVYGMLLLSSAVPASRAGRGDDARDMIRQAKGAAELSGNIRLFGTSFGRASVGMQATTVSVSLEDYGQALDDAGETPAAELQWKISRARHKLDVAYARFQTGDDDKARVLLLELDDAQPEWIGHQLLASTTADGLLERAARRDRRLRSLAARLRVSV